VVYAVAWAAESLPGRAGDGEILIDIGQMREQLARRR
jgi:hypothetical protein